MAFRATASPVSGAPQGDPLSPLLFILCVDALFRMFKGRLRPVCSKTLESEMSESKLYNLWMTYSSFWMAPSVSGSH
ncbi:hypothetical protein ACMD2_26383 [Ananas comosus]|uniref:Reverse transcriptase domain-containing protein n=1 Tax=Ananas comosus TaxID=4615 RepID=A0A199UT99_ANACO|nr:hypothetical protein ACMD2_26383 [Ananas comosus]